MIFSTTKQKVEQVSPKDPAKMEVPAMGSVVARVKTLGHYGALQLKLDHRLGKEPQLDTYVDSTKNASEDCCIWSFHN